VSKKRRQQLPAPQVLSPPSRSETLAQFAITAHHFSGPLPPSEILRKYDELLPGSAERIIAMVEKQGAHRQGLESEVVKSNCKNERLGMIFGLIICVMAIVAGIYAVKMGKEGFGIAAIISALAAPMAVFIYGKSRQKKDLQASQQGIIEAARQTQRPG
jgi:uncharacterized membrane protein